MSSYFSGKLIADRFSWDLKEYAYKITEPPVPSQVTDLDTFAFVIRTRARKFSAKQVEL